jgi:orotidine-5'-phosphate decarboxylase
MSIPHLGLRLAERVAARQSQIMLGLDPDPGRLWPEAVTASERTGRVSATAHDRAAAAVLAHCLAVVDAVAPAVVAVKPQVACFERLGRPGRAVLEAVCEHAQNLGLLVLADAKRGDIDVTARAYAETYLGSTQSPFGTLEGLGADAMTAAPYMGEDTLRPLMEVARPHGRGIFVLVRTSNPGAADLEDLETTAGGPVWAHVARIVDRLGREAPATAEVGAAGQGTLADVGAVVGATAPEHVAQLRELMPRTPFLLPGWAPRAAGSRTSRPRGRPAAPAAWSPRRAPSSTPTRAERGRREPPRGRRPSACATPPGRWVDPFSLPAPYPRPLMLAGNPARLLAPLALVAAALAIYLVVRSELSDGAAGPPTRPAATTTETRTSTTSGKSKSGSGSSKRPKTYTVRPGDVLSGIAERTGVSLSRLQELNPDVDPQALRSGQKLKLRE